MQQFGDLFTQRIFTAGEIAYANGAADKLAARFAAKEAAIKAFDLSETGLDWRHIEVASSVSGRPMLRLQGAAAARATEIGAQEIAVSMSHEGDVALAAVIVYLDLEASPSNPSAPAAVDSNASIA